MSNASSFSDGSDAPQAVFPSPELNTHKIPVNYSEGKEVSSLDRGAYARNQPYGPSCYNHYKAGYGDCYDNYDRELQPRHVEFLRPTVSRRICGLRPAWFWTTAVLVVLLLIGATAGAVVGGMMRRQIKTSSPSPSTSSAAKAELLGSQLSAVNWTDSTGAQRRAIFYQRNGTLHVSHNAAGVDGKRVWGELDIEAQFPAGAVGAMNATPLAASFKSADAGKDMSFSAALYYLDTENNIRDLVSTADDLSTWSKGPLWGVTVAANPMSGLAAAAHMCAKGCLGDRIVVFQGTGGDLFAVNGPRWTEPPTRIVAANIGTPLALTQAAYVNGSSDDPPVQWTAEQTQLRLYYHRAQNIDEYLFNDKTPLAWTPGFVGVASGLETDAARGLAASPSGPNSVVQVVTLKNSGSAVVSFVKGSTGHFEDSTVDLPARFTDGGDVITGVPSQGASAITLSHNFGFYVLTEDGKQILECKSDCPYYNYIPSSHNICRFPA
ncbi:hypothetical protein KVR01_013525 [Diaporthe batatas]|uniref:uncharacterized protein n=1 Tax=Diaporthe batatas TaxID=748121 RepID=UPI001D0509D4|nr:uncharacterized protein KVR01_013525 [Diaporthe batatas]KAG8156574.1 hypothetical protein KVR01_013525 [Diaporthe batatas]